MTSAYRRDRMSRVRNDEFSDLLNTAGQGIINNQVAFFEGVIDVDTLPDGVFPSEGQRLALRRAMARYLIDSGIASERGWLS